MTDLVNFIQINPENSRITGNIATLSFDIDVTGEPLSSTNPKAPTFRLYGLTPRMRRIDIGGIWTRQNSEGKNYFTLSVCTGLGRYNANLGRYPGQDDTSLYAVIAWA